MKKTGMNEFPLLDEKEGIPLFYPYVPESAIDEVSSTLRSRWIGQGPKVELFENKFRERFLGKNVPLAVGSGTAALHLSYLLSGVEAGDEVIVPIFTCTATNIPLLYIGAKPVFADIDPETMNIDVGDIESRINKKTKAIVAVDYGGVPCDYDALHSLCKKYGLKLIEDAAHALGSKYNGVGVGQLADFTIFSFQAIKTLTTGDGGLLAIREAELEGKGKRLRWFGIDRAAKQGGIWENDLTEIGYKYQMTDIAASLGLAALAEVDKTIAYRNELFAVYEKELSGAAGMKLIGHARTDKYFNSAWLATILVESNRIELMKKLRSHKIESAQVHYRNDRYAIFGDRREDLPNMDAAEDKYLVLPLHMRMREENIRTIAKVVKDGW